MLRSVQLDEEVVEFSLSAKVATRDRGLDFAADVLHGAATAESAIALHIAVAQLMRFGRARGRAGGDGDGGYGTVGQGAGGLHRGPAAAVQDFDGG